MTTWKPSAVPVLKSLRSSLTMICAGFGILGEHADVERAVVVEQLDFGVEGRRLALARIVLHEVGRERRRRPRRLIELAVERDRPLRLRGLQPALVAGGVVIDAAVLRGLRGGDARPSRQTSRQRAGGRVACASSSRVYVRQWMVWQPCMFA